MTKQAKENIEESVKQGLEDSAELRETITSLVMEGLDDMLPEEVFGKEVLQEWAEENGYKKSED